MTEIQLLSIILVFVGAAFIFAAFFPAQKALRTVPPELKRKWVILVYLMYFFLGGYLFFDAVLISRMRFPLEFVTGAVFFGGAFFVFIIINLAQSTIGRIRDVEKDFQDLFENANDLIQSVGPDGTILYVNRSWRHTLGYAETDIPGLSIFDVIHPEHRPHCTAVLKETMAGRNTRVETVFVARDGRKIIVEGNINCRLKDGASLATRGIFRDITARKQAEEDLRALNESLEQRVNERTRELKRSYEFSRTVLDSIRDSISIIDVGSYRIVGANRQFLADVGMTEQQAVGRTCYDVTHQRQDPCAPPHDVCPFADMLAEESHAAVEHVHTDAGGEKRYAEITVSPIRDETGKIIQAVHIARDITERKRAEERIRTLAYYDNLTGLPNRTFYRELLVRALTYTQRHKRIMAVLFVDLDSFKKINDTLGHDAGDELLKTVAARLTTCVRKSDYVARSENAAVENTVSRLGGDEFIVLLTEIARDQDAARVAARVLAEIARPVMLCGQEVFVSASIGIALYPADGADAETLLKNADSAMYAVKEGGKNAYQFYAESMNASALERLSLENGLHRALERNEFVLHYQPKIDATTGAVIGLEALVRWRHPERGLVPPGEFIPVAEETGLIVTIGEWVLREACCQARAWHEAGTAPVPVAVNVSRRQFDLSKFAERVEAILAETGLAPQHLELEITESTIMHNPESVIAALQRLKSLGVRISIDDFGTGYSSLEYLRCLALDTLKIDRTFIMNLPHSERDAAITSAIMAMAHRLNLNVVAEGVETEEQLAALLSMGCREVQGFLFSRPVPAEECPRLFASAPSSR